MLPDPTLFPNDDEYPGFYSGEFGPRLSVSSIAESPLQLLLFFAPKKLWRHIARESNRHSNQQLVKGVDRLYENQGDSGTRTKEAIMRQEAKN